MDLQVRWVCLFFWTLVLLFFSLKLHLFFIYVLSVLFFLEVCFSREYSHVVYFPTLFHLEVSHHDSLKVYFCWSPMKKGEYWKGSLLSARASEWFLLGGIPNNPLQTCLLSIRDQLGGQQQVFFPGLFSPKWRLKDFPCKQQILWQPTCTGCFSSGVWIEWLMQCHEGTIFQREIIIDYKFQWCRNCCSLMFKMYQFWAYQQLAERIRV